VHAEHLALADILRLLSLGSIDYHAVLANKRQCEVREDVAAAADNNAKQAQLEREKLLAENERFREGYNVLLEFWQYLPQDQHAQLSQRLAKAGIKTVRIEDGGVLYLPPNTTNHIVRALYGDPETPTANASRVLQPAFEDVTHVVRALLLDEGIPRVVVSQKLLLPNKPQSVKMVRGTTAADSLLPEGSGEAGGGRGGGGGGGGSAQGGHKQLVLAYIPSEAARVEKRAWFLRRKESEMAEEALHSLAELLDKWGVSVEELMNELGVEEDGGDEGGKLTWEGFLAAVKQLPVVLGGEKELRAAVEIGRASKGAKLNIPLVRSKIEAHYWCLVAKGLQKFVTAAPAHPLLARGAGKFSSFTPKGAQHQQSLAHLRAHSDHRPRSSTPASDMQGSDHDLAPAVSALEKRLQEAENRVCMQALYIDSLQISLGFAKLVADERDPKQELTLLLAEQQRERQEQSQKRLQDNAPR
jgi:hypothetical protein